MQRKKKDILKNLYAFFDGRERILDAFESKIFLIKIEGIGFEDLSMQDKISSHLSLKILTPKQMLEICQ